MEATATQSSAIQSSATQPMDMQATAMQPTATQSMAMQPAATQALETLVERMATDSTVVPSPAVKKPATRPPLARDWVKSKWYPRNNLWRQLNARAWTKWVDDKYEEALESLKHLPLEDAKREAVETVKPYLRRNIRFQTWRHCKLVQRTRRDPIYKKIMDDYSQLMKEDFDTDSALRVAIKKHEGLIYDIVSV